MKLQTIDAKLLQRMIVAGAKLLDEKKQMINELNVFPVPDGDTGTNMSLTMLAAAKEVESVESVSVTSIAAAAASGSLRGARGNSGVILSQLIRGFAKGISEEDTIDTLTLANAFQTGVDTAYKAVMKPKEGTILTVAREVASKAMQLSMEITDLKEFAQKVLQHGYDVLNQTPDMLPVLKEAGVVDAGGQGLLSILEGAAMVMTGDMTIEIKKPDNKPNQNAFNALKNFNTEDITFGYCTEFIVNRDPKADYDEEKTKGYLETIGDSIVVVSDETFIKVHVHTDNPGHALQKALEYGSLSSVKIENMREQHSSILSDEPVATAKGPRKDVAFVSIAAGSGIAEIMKSLGVDVVIEGGQTMNPSTEDIIAAVEEAHAEHVIILPNNKNIILAAEQAARIEERCKVHVIPSKTIPQGITAMVNYDTNEEAEAVVETMQEAIQTVQTAQITIAVRDTTIDGQDIKEGEYLGLLEGAIVVHNKDLKLTFAQLLDKMNQEAEIITVYYGEDIEASDAEDYLTVAEEKFTDADVELHSGNQPVYYFMISAE